MSCLPVAQVERLFTVAQAAELLGTTARFPRRHWVFWLERGEGNRTLMTSLEGCDYPLPD